MREIKIAPSILAADFTRLGEEIASVESGDYLHFDVMDGCFVPNISFGTPLVHSIRKATSMPLDVHLMITRPIRFVETFARLGADIITFHVEADEPDEIRKAVGSVKALGKRAGLSIKPGTPAKALEPYLEALDMVLVMTVEPGFGGQGFMADMLPKIETVRSRIERLGLDCELEVDGGINHDTARLCREAGANVLVAGSSIFERADRHRAIEELRG